MQAKKIKLSQLSPNTGQIEEVPKNPRFIRDEKFYALKKSLQDTPEMLELRELVAYNNNGELVVILGNMRFRALKELGVTETFVKVLPAETPKRNLRAYVIKDNVNNGEHDFDALANDWELEELQFDGLSIPNIDFANVYEPMLVPTTSQGEVTDKDIEKGKEGLISISTRCIYTTRLSIIGCELAS